MSNIGSLGAPAPVYGSPAAISADTLTPDALMIYCATQLHGMDDQINGSMAQQEAERDGQAKLATLKQDLQNYASGGIGPNDAASRDRMLNEMKAAYDALPADSPARAQLETLFNKFRTTACFNDDPSHAVSLATYTSQQASDDAGVGKPNAGDDGQGHNLVANWEITDPQSGFLSQIDDISGSIGKNADIEMINLQSLVSQRQTAVQLCTNLMSKLDDTLNAVVQNVKS